MCFVFLFAGDGFDDVVIADAVVVLVVDVERLVRGRYTLEPFKNRTFRRTGKVI